MTFEERLEQEQRAADASGVWDAPASHRRDVDWAAIEHLRKNAGCWGYKLEFQLVPVAEGESTESTVWVVQRGRLFRSLPPVGWEWEVTGAGRFSTAEAAIRARDEMLTGLADPGVTFRVVECYQRDRVLL